MQKRFIDEHGRFTEEQIIGVLKQHEAGRKVAELPKTPALGTSISCGDSFTAFLVARSRDMGVLRY
jgi:hypothetical protein